MEEAQIQKGRKALLFMQTFSTLGYSILYSTLVLYATQGLGLADHLATALTGSFIAFNYALHVLGGYIGGRFLSYRALFLYGMLAQVVGSLIISIPTLSALIWGSAFFLTGAGLNTICINCMLTQLYKPHDKRREFAFLWNYSGMNLGFFIGFSVSGYFQLHQNYHTLFLLAGFGSLISFTLTLVFWKYLNDLGTIYAETNLHNRKKRILLASGMILGLFLALSQLLQHASLSNVLILFFGIVVAVALAILSFKQPTFESAQKMRAFLLLTVCSLIFWSLYQMAPMGLTLFYDRNVYPMLFGLQIAPQWMQNINTIVIVLGGPILASLNQKLRHKGFKISLPFQFSTALLLIGFGFLLLPLGIAFADPKGFSSIWWIIGSYLLQSIGELFISPIGYAMVGQLIPTKLQGFAMGSWLMVSGVAAVLSNYFSQYALGTSDSIDPLITNGSYAEAFLVLGAIALLGGILVALFRSFLHKLIQEKKEPTLHDIEPAPYNCSVD